MPRPPGRDQSAPMERLVRLLGALNQHPAGAPAELLMRVVAGEHGTDEARRRMLSRDLEQLNSLGYDIRNVADAGAEGRYVMRARDNRLQVHLSAEQRGELLRAALAAGLDDLAAHLGEDDGAQGPHLPANANLDLVQRATARRCLVRFDYKGEARVAHPVRLHSGPSGWYLTAREDGTAGGATKEFVVSRMSQVELGAPGSASVPVDSPRPSLDPLRWLVDAPTDVVVETDSQHRHLAEQLLGTPRQVTARDGKVELGFVVTNRAVFRWRVYELGQRVRVLAPPDVRAELIADLETYLTGPS